MSLQRYPKTVTYNGQSLTVYALVGTVDFARKPRTLGELHQGGERNKVLITETIELDWDAFHEFLDALLGDYPWLKGKPAGEINGARLCIEVVCAGMKSLIIDTEGYDYARRIASC